MTGLSDSFHRPVDYLRISVTDRCNLRCVYCMPASGVRLMPRSDLLSYEELYRVARAAAELGINRVRLTGGEPLVRLGLSRLVEMLASIDGIKDISLTTNGLLLSRYAAGLKRAGLRRVNVSLDSLKPERFRTVTRGRYTPRRVLDGIEAAKSVGLEPVKINVVVMGGVNDDELTDFAAKTVTEGWHVRFIELMPLVGEDTPSTRLVPVAEIKKRIDKLGELAPGSPGVGNGPAKYFRLPGASGTIGFITPVTEHFCFNCNRLRLTSDGKLRPCLLSGDEIDLRQPLRNGTNDDLKDLIKKAVASKPLRHHMGEGDVPRDRPFSQVGG